MSRILRFKSSLAWIVFLEICLLVFLLIQGRILSMDSNNALLNSFAEELDDTNWSYHENLPTKLYFNAHECNNFSVLPDLELTADTKAFLEQHHYIGYLGTNASFQKILSRLSVQQIVANLLLKPEAVNYINTVQINVSMLSVEQLRASYMFCCNLIQDLNTMYYSYDCTQGQVELINEILPRLSYLKAAFRSDLEALNAFDRSLDIQVLNYQVRANHQ